MYFRLGHLPIIGEVVEFDNLLITVKQADEHRINKVRIKRLNNKVVGEDNNANDLK